MTIINHTKRILFLLLFCILLPRALLAQEELTFVAERDTVAFGAESIETIVIHAGDLVTTRTWIDYSPLSFPSNEFHLTIRFGELGRWYMIRAKDFLPMDTEDIFGDDIFIDHPISRSPQNPRQAVLTPIAIGDASEMWVPALYRDILAGQNRDTLLEMIPGLEMLNDRDYHLFGVGWRWFENTHAGILNGRTMFYNSVISIGMGTFIAVRNIRRTDFGYRVDGIISLLDEFRRAPFYFLYGSTFWERYRPREVVTLLLHLDGDYLDIFTCDSDIHVGTFIRVGREFIAQYQSLIQTNTADLTNVQWPRRADGSMSVVPPAFTPIVQEVPETAYAGVVEGEAPAHILELFEEQAPATSGANSEESGTPPWALIALIGGAVIIAGGVVLVVTKRKRA